MKSIFTKLSTLLLCGAVALVGCSDFSADLRDVNQRVDELEESAATKVEVAVLRAEIEKLKDLLKNQYTTNEEVAQITATIEKVQTEVEKAKENLQDAIDNKADKTELDKTVTDLEQTIEDAKEELAGVLGNLTVDNGELKETVSGLVTDLGTLRDDVEKLKTDLGNLTGEVAQLTIKLNELAAKVDGLVKDLADLKTAFESYKTEINEQITEINLSISNLRTELTEELDGIKSDVEGKADLSAITSLQAGLDEVNKAMDALTTLVNGAATKEELADAIKALKDELVADLEDLKSQISGTASKADLEALQAIVDGKATQEDVNRLENLLAGSASQKDLDALQALLDGKATQEDIDRLTERLDGTASKKDLDALEALIGGNASQEDIDRLEDLIAGAGSQEDMDALQALIDGKATKEDIETLKELIGGSVSQAAIDEAVNALRDELKADIDALRTLVEGTPSQSEVEGLLDALEAELTGDINILKDLLDGKADQGKIDSAVNALESVLNSKIDRLDSAIAGKADQEDIKAAVDALDKVLSADIAKLESIVNAWEDKDTVYDDTELKAAIDNAAAQYKSLSEDLQNQIDALEESLSELANKVEDMVTSLRSVVLIPETVYNGTKAVKFHRMEGENVLKTFANVSFHFNPSNFDLESATYEVMAENVEFMTKAATETPAITIVGKPVKNGDKVTFLFERAEGAGNMFALKVTLADGNVIYSEYAAILDEITYCVADATMKMDVQRLVFEMPTITSLSELIELVQCAGTRLEDFQLTIDTIKGAYEALQTNNLLAAFDLIKSLPGFTTKVVTLTGKGHCEEIVESITAEKLLEELKNSLDLGFDEFLKKFNDLLGLAGGLGQGGSDILEGLENSFANSQINGSLGQLEEAIKAFDASEVAYENTKKLLDAAEAEAAKAKSQLDEKQATYEAEKAKLDAISNKLSLEYIKQSAVVTAAWTAVESAELAVRIADAAIPAAKENLEKAKENVDKLEAKIEEIKQQIKDQTKDYIENSELGQKIKELENALAEKNWEVQKNTAKYLAEIKAVKMASEDIMSNYKALNQQVVDEFNCSIFGRILAILNTTEAEKVFEELCLTELYNALKLLPDMITTATKYYPALNLNTLEDFPTLIKDITTGAEGTLQGALDSLVKGEMPELNINSEYLTVESFFRVEYELAE